MNNAVNEINFRRGTLRSGTIIAVIGALYLWSCARVPSQINEAKTTTQLEPVIVTDSARGLHDVDSESDLVGPANQPEWTARRAFAETDIYVIPEGEIEFNQFYISSHARHGKPAHLFESELEFGLPWRTQFDIETSYAVEAGDLRHDDVLLELPHALADWGEIPLNPTINGGWRFITDEADAYFFRVMLAEEFCKRVHFGASFTFDQQIGGQRERAYELNTALSYVVKDQKVTLGMEFLIEFESEVEKVGSFNERETETVAMFGPSLLYKPTRNTHLALVPLFGLTRESPVVEVFFIFGVDFDFGRWTSSDGGTTRPVRRYR